MPDAHFRVKQFLQSKNCDAKCGEAAPCEGEIVGLKGLVDESNVNPETLQFYVLDEKDEDFRMEVKVDPAISTEAFEKIRFRNTNDIRVRGEIQGYDQQMNFNCKRGFTLRLNALSDLIVD